MGVSEWSTHRQHPVGLLIPEKIAGLPSRADLTKGGKDRVKSERGLCRLAFEQKRPMKFWAKLCKASDSPLRIPERKLG